MPVVDVYGTPAGLLFAEGKHTTVRRSTSASDGVTWTAPSD